MTSIRLPASDRGWRAAFWVVLVAFVVLGILGGMGRGPGLLIGAIVLAVYATVRRRHLRPGRYAVLIGGMAFVSAVGLSV